MSYGSTTLNPCETIQDELNEMFMTCDASRLREPSPFFDFVMSSENMAGVAQEVSPGGGKTRTVNLRYDQRINEDNVKSNQSNPNCVATTKRGDCIEAYTIDITQNEQIEQLIDIADLVEICRTNENYWAENIQRLIDALVRKIATKTTQQAVLLTGKWGADVDNVDVNDNLEVSTLRAGTTDEVAPFTMEDIDMALMQSAYCGPVGIFGGSALYKYARRVMAGCCSNQGVNLGEIMAQYGKAVAYDRRVANELGGNNFNFVVQSGALQLITFNMFEGAEGLNVITGSDYSRTVIVDPQSGLPIDLTIKDNCGQVSVILTATTKLISMPDDMFGTGDIYDGCKFFNTIEVVNS